MHTRKPTRNLSKLTTRLEAIEKALSPVVASDIDILTEIKLAPAAVKEGRPSNAYRRQWDRRFDGWCAQIDTNVAALLAVKSLMGCDD